MPSWAFYRDMQFARQRSLLAIEPVLGFIVMMGLGAAGAGYWSLVVGVVVGTWAAAAASLIASPYPIRWRFDRGSLRSYYSFSWPLLLSAGSGLVTVQLAVILGNATVGLAGVGAIGLSGTIAAFSDRVDGIVTQTLYPAICAVRDRTALLLEAFTKSNRFALLWGMPFGLGLALFAPDLVHYVLGSKWDVATGLLQVFGVTQALKQIAFNWTAFHRAVGETRPIAVNGIAAMAAFAATVIPGMILWGLTGYAVAICVMTAVEIGIRAYYLSRLFDGFGMLRHSLRAIAPSVPAVLAVLGLRLLVDGDRTGGMVIAELCLYVVVTVAATWLMERALLKEVLGYLRSTPQPARAA
jgi:O-antigen/teichoic acid export membrane protein